MTIAILIFSILTFATSVLLLVALILCGAAIWHSLKRDLEVMYQPEHECDCHTVPRLH